MSHSGTRVALVLLVFAVVGTASPIDDSVVVKVSKQDRSSHREEKKFRDSPVSTCFTRNGVQGRCTSLGECYTNFKLKEITSNTCSYFTATGSKMFGVCCTNQPTEAVMTTEGPRPGDRPISSTSILNQLPLRGAYPVTNSTSESTTQPPTTSEDWPPADLTLWNLTLADLVAGTICGYQDERRIVNGQASAIGEWPWMAALLVDDRQFCGGSLVNNIYILTASHCIDNIIYLLDPERITVRLGGHVIITDLEVQHVDRKVEKIFRHQQFDSLNILNDIALLKMDSPVTFTRSINPICLPFGHEDYTGESATAIGWGKLSNGGPEPIFLQKVTIPILSNHECQIKYGDLAKVGIPYHFLCAGDGIRDTCNGDSGGPLMINNGRWTQVGITSWGYRCGLLEHPGVYTRVTTYTGWIVMKILNVTTL